MSNHTKKVKRENIEVFGKFDFILAEENSPIGGFDLTNRMIFDTNRCDFQSL